MSAAVTNATVDTAPKTKVLSPKDLHQAAADDNGLSPTVTNETVPTGQEKARQSSPPKQNPFSDFSPEVFRTILGTLSVNDLKNFSLTDKSTREGMSYLNDLRKAVKNFDIRTDKNALNTIQSFCTDIARLPIDYQALPLSDLAQKIHLLSMEHQTDGYLAVRAVSDYLPLAHQDQVLRAPGMAQNLTIQSDELNRQIDKFFSLHDEEMMNFFPSIMAKIATLPPRQQAMALNDHFREIIVAIPWRLQNHAIGAVLQQNARVPKELQPGILEKCIEFSIRYIEKWHEKIALVEAALTRSASLPNELQREVLEKCIEFTKSLKSWKSTSVVELVLKQIANLPQEHQSTLVVQVLNNLNNVTVADLKALRAQSISLPEDLQAAVLGKLIECITSTGKSAVKSRDHAANGLFAEAIRMQSTRLPPQLQAAVLEKFLIYVRRATRWESQEQFNATLKQSAALPLEYRAAALENLAGSIFGLPDEEWENAAKAIQLQNATL